MPANPRAALAGDLAEHVARLLAAGDLDGARLAHETLGKLLAPPEPPSANGTHVVDLAAQRRRRDGR